MDGRAGGDAADQPAAALALTLMTVSHHNGMARAEGGMGALSTALAASSRLTAARYISEHEVTECS